MLLLHRLTVTPLRKYSCRPEHRPLLFISQKTHHRFNYVSASNCYPNYSLSRRVNVLRRFVEPQELGEQEARKKSTVIFGENRRDRNARRGQGSPIISSYRRLFSLVRSTRIPNNDATRGNFSVHAQLFFSFLPSKDARGQRLGGEKR